MNRFRQFICAAIPASGCILAASSASADTIPPSVPNGVQATVRTVNSVTLTWQASTDSGGAGLAGYRIYRDGGSSAVGTSTTTTFTDPNRTAGTTYAYRVSAIDRAAPANESAQSTAVSATTATSSASCSVAINGGAPVMNVGQRAVITTIVTGGTLPVTYQWSVTGQIIKDYEDRTASPWSVTPMSTADFQQSTIAFYWKPDATQRHPSNAGPINRSVSLTVRAGAATCNAQRVFSVERNATSISRQAEDFYTANHPDSAGRGRVRNDHSAWHRDWMPGVNNFGTTFFDFHREFVNRFNRWRQEFGYRPIQTWNPGTPLPVGAEVDHSSRNTTYVLTPLPSWFTLAGGSATRPSNGTACDTRAGQNDLLDFSDRNLLGCAINRPMHSGVHNNIGGSMASTLNSPLDPIFWRWHLYMDGVSQAWLTGSGGVASSGTTISGTAIYAEPNAESVTQAVAARNDEHQQGEFADEAAQSSAAELSVRKQSSAHTAHVHHPPAAATAGPNVTLLTEEAPEPVIRTRGKAERGPRIIYESPFRTRPFVTALPALTVTFSVPVFDLAANMLTVNGSPATRVHGEGAGPYVFSGFESSNDSVLQVRFEGRRVRDAEGNRGGTRTWRYWVVEAGSDVDGDGLDDAEEVSLHMTNPRLRDTDSDGMPDGFEVPRACLDPFEDERAPHDMSGAIRPGDDDADDDGYDNLAEYYSGSDPCSP